MKRLLSLFLALVLSFSMVLPTYAKKEDIKNPEEQEDTDDTYPPTLDTIRVSESKIYPKGKLTVSANATDDDSGIDWIDALFTHQGSNTMYQVRLYRNGNKDIKEDYSGVLTLPETAPLGSYLLTRVTLMDNDKNESRYYRGTPPRLNSSIEVFPLEQSINFVVGDYFTRYQPYYSRVAIVDGDYVLHTSAKGGYGGIDKITVLYINEENQHKIIQTVGEDERQPDGSYKTVLNISPYEPTGTFVLKKIILKDSTGNKETYSSDREEDDTLPLPVISRFQVVTKAEDTTNPVLLSYQILGTGLDPFNDEKMAVSLQVNATDDLAGIHHITVKFKNHATDKTLRKVLYPADLVTGNRYEGILKVDLEDDIGTWTLDGITLVDNAGNQLSYKPVNDVKEDDLPLPKIVSFACQGTRRVS